MCTTLSVEKLASFDHSLNIVVMFRQIQKCPAKIHFGWTCPTKFTTLFLPLLLYLNDIKQVILL